MNRLLMVPLLLGMFALGGCENFRVVTGESVLVGGTSVTAPVSNPVGKKELAAVENAYGLAVTIAVAYKRLPLCKADQVESLNNVCSRRNVVLTLQEYDRRAYAAIRVARSFVKDNPTLNAISAINAARQAVADFQNISAFNGVK